MSVVNLFRIKQGDRRPYLYATLGPLNEDQEVDGQDLTGATITFNMRNAAGDVVIEGGAVVVDDALTGEVHYPWQAGETDEVGDYIGEFQAAYGTETETFPNDKLGFRIKITPQIA